METWISEGLLQPVATNSGQAAGGSEVKWCPRASVLQRLSEASWAFLLTEAYSFRTVGGHVMSIFLGRLGLAFLLTTLCLGGRTAYAQAAAVTYWIPNWPVGFAGNLIVNQSSGTYGN